MSVANSSDVPPLEVVVQLLDAARGSPVKTWKFVGRASIKIGRADEQDVEISDPYVSRLHAELEWREGAWILISRGRNGVLVANRPVTEMSVKHEVIFQLGASGPTFRFRSAVEEDNSRRTLDFDLEPLPDLKLDAARLRAEVDEIEGGDYFRKLLNQAKTLRHQRTDRAVQTEQTRQEDR
jgi:pSer/pThr/pTyr-binding forkhead associated (FHA) protein